MTVNTHIIDKSLTGTGVNNRIQYWKSFDEHKNKIKKEIEAEKAEISECEKNIKELEEELLKVEEQHKFFVEDDYVQSYTFSEDMHKKHPEFCKKAEDIIRGHELQYHPGLVGNFVKSVSHGFHSVMNEKIPNYEFLGRDSDPWDIHYIRCVDCYRQSILSDGRADHYFMSISDNPGNK